MGRTLHYEITGATVIGRFEAIRVLSNQVLWNQRFTWTCEQLSLDRMRVYPFWPRGDGSRLPADVTGAEGWAIVETLLRQGFSVRELADEKIVFVDQGESASGMTGFTKVGDVGTALVRGFGANRYLAPMLLGERWQRVDGWHGTNMAEPEWAADYVRETGDLWRRHPESADLLRRWWHAEAVRAWRARLDELMVRSKDIGDGDVRSTALRESGELQGERAIGALVRPMLAGAT